MQMDARPGKTVVGVRQERTVFLLLYNLVRRVIVQSAKHQPVDVERISVIDALRGCSEPDSGGP